MSRKGRAENGGEKEERIEKEGGRQSEKTDTEGRRRERERDRGREKVIEETARGVV